MNQKLSIGIFFCLSSYLFKIEI
nr:cytochrome b6/f complex subunit VI [Debregeasia elliptica]UED14230.1 cytochrome b6/f complex subunit VI [Debregeasia elliptica]